MMPRSVSVILPVMDETYSLRKTVEILMEQNDQWIRELIFAIHPQRTKSESLEVIHEIQGQYPDRCTVHPQVKPFVGGAISEAFLLAKGEYTVLMASDLETDPGIVKEMITVIGDPSGGWDIVATSRWLQGGGFVGYHPLKWALNYVFQGIIRVLYRVRLTDMTYAFRIYKTHILREIDWIEGKHPFFLETLLKPLRLGYRVTEIPTNWTSRTEGVSQNSFFQNFDYIRMAWQVRWKPVDFFLRKIT